MLNRFSQLVMTLHRGCREQPMTEYQNWALEQLRLELPFDSGLWLAGTLHRDHQATIHTIHAHRVSPQIVVDWGRVSQGRAVLTERVFHSPGVTYNCAVAKEFGPELAEHSKRYCVEHILATVSLDPVSKLSEMISIYRADLDKPFNEDERLFQQCIIPHLTETWRINRMHHMSLMQQPSCSPFARSAMVDKKGILHLIDPGLTSLLLGEWPAWQGPALPDELVRSIGNGSGHFSGNTLVAKFTKIGDLLLLRGRNKSLLDSLSGRQQQVANLFVSGHTYKGIADSLRLSPATVRNHLQSIYSRLGISNKVELRAILKDQGS